jgi:hypothetical protein
MSFLLFVRRLHLYLGLFLLPWVVLFGITSWPFSHPAPVQPKWTVRIDRSYALDVAPGADLRAIGARIHEDAGFRGGFYVNRPNPQRINVHHPDFFHPTRITYFVDQGRLLAEEREFVLRQASRACTRTRATIWGDSGTSSGRSWWTSSASPSSCGSPPGSSCGGCSREAGRGDGWRLRPA